MSVGTLTLILFGGIILFMATGLPVAFCLGGVALAMSIALEGSKALIVIPFTTWGLMTNFTLIAIPLFVFIGNLLEKSGIAEALYAMLYAWLGRLRGGLLLGTILVCTVLAAMVGLISASILVLGVVAVPSMLKRSYDKHLVYGTLMAGSALGALIPPSVVMMLYAAIAQQSVGKMFVAGIIPGLLLAAMYMAYITLRCALKPELAPAIPREESPSWNERFGSMKGAIIPMVLIFLMLGTIILGIATPTEAAAVGTLGVIISLAINRRLNWSLVWESLTNTAKLLGMGLWIVIGAMYFSHVYMTLGAAVWLGDVINGLQVSPWVVLIIIQSIMVLLGMILEEWAIVMIMTPICVPIIVNLGFDPLWFAILVMINMQIAVLTPPFGIVLFFMKGLRPQEDMPTLWRSIAPFTMIQVVGLVLCMVFPELILYLPRIVFE